MGCRDPFLLARVPESAREDEEEVVALVCISCLSFWRSVYETFSSSAAAATLRTIQIDEGFLWLVVNQPWLVLWNQKLLLLTAVRVVAATWSPSQTQLLPDLSRANERFRLAAVAGGSKNFSG